jgi:class 3 adenylate cyclase
VSFLDLSRPEDRLALQGFGIAQRTLVKEFLQRTPVLKTTLQLRDELVGDIDGEAASFDSSIKDMTGVLFATATAFAVLPNTRASPQAQGAERRRPQIVSLFSEPPLDIAKSVSFGRHEVCVPHSTHTVKKKVKTFMFTISCEFCDRNYLGRDPGRRVLQGRIARGIAERIEAVLWFSDLHSYTRISDTTSPEHIIPLLNHYADAIISAIHEHGGDVLRLIGDGALAIFTAEDRGRACDAALNAALAARRRVAAVSQRRAAKGLPTTDMYLGLHVGEVFYGNIGSKDRLDFTVVGPAVNEVSRIVAMCRTVDQPLLVSSAFTSAIGEARSRFVSVGRYALRGVGRAQDLFTLELE